MPTPGVTISLNGRRGRVSTSPGAPRPTRDCRNRPQLDSGPEGPVTLEPVDDVPDLRENAPLIVQRGESLNRRKAVRTWRR